MKTFGKSFLLSSLAIAGCLTLGCSIDSSEQPSEQTCEDAGCPEGQDCRDGSCQKESPKNNCGDGVCKGKETCANCPDDCGECEGYCGDQICNADETCSSCPVDCSECEGYCGDQICNADETCSSCPVDCGECSESCGDDVCDEDETCSNCPDDCGKCKEFCGDLICNANETCASCPSDCGICEEYCGDQICNGSETCSSCPVDCGICEEYCGDQVCNGYETCKTCPADCGKCAEVCGDKVCNSDENCLNCPEDCGKCKEYCGDKNCSENESCSTCPEDCGPCEYCGDNICQPDETYESCKKDCLSLHPCANGCPKKAVFLYTGKPYQAYTSEDIDRFGLTHFVLCPSAMTPDTWGYGDAEHRFPGLVKQMVSAIDVIIQSTNGENKRFWIGTPMSQRGGDIKESNYPNPKYTAAEFFEIHRQMYINYIDDMRAALGAEKWNKYVVGIYMHSEDVLGKEIGYPYKDASKLLTNPHVKLFNDIAQYVHKPYSSGGKIWNAVEFLWSPFYHNPEAWIESEKINQMGAIVNTLNIFDDVIIQVGHYENNVPKNMEIIKNGTYNNVVYNRSSAIAGGSKKSNTRIGVQMEFSDDIFNTAHADKKKRYYETEACFNNETYVINGYNKDNYLISFYFAQKSDNLPKSQEIIRKFFNVIPF